jgi:hypothetical protein
MRVVNLTGRSTIVTNDGLMDVAASSQGASLASIDRYIGQLDKLQKWYESSQPTVGVRATK